MKKLLSGMLAVVLVMGALCLPSFAVQHKVPDTLHEKPLRNMLNITAETVEKGEPIDVGNLITAHNYNYPVASFRTTGVTQVFFGDAGDMDCFVGYAPTLAALRNSDYTFVSPETKSWYTGSFVLDKPGYYVVYYAHWDYPGKGTYIIEMKTGKSGAPLSFLRSFSDVTEGRWSYNNIMDLIGHDTFAGVGQRDKNGVGTFDPEGTMTQAQFITVLTKLLYEKEVDAMTPGENWYSNFYTVAHSKKLLPEGMFPETDADQPITREQMSMLAILTLKKSGRPVKYMADPKFIADFDSVGDIYGDYVRMAFYIKLLTGYDDKGTFKPQNTLTREEAATVVHKLIFSYGV